MSETGTVVNVVENRGFFFVRPDSGGKDIFGHMKEIEKAGMNRPEVGDRLEYEIQTTQKGPQATHLRSVL